MKPLDRARIVFIAVVSLTVALPAIAQTTIEPLEYRIDLKPLLDQVVWPLAGVIVTAIATMLAAKINAWLNLSQDSMVRSYLEQALASAVLYARSKYSAETPLSITVRNQMVADAATYATRHVPDALKRFGIDESSLKRMLVARIEAGTATVITKPAADAELRRLDEHFQPKPRM